MNKEEAAELALEIIDNLAMEQTASREEVLAALRQASVRDEIAIAISWIRDEWEREDK